MFKLWRNRYVAGNTCFILFLVFLFSLTFAAFPNAASAAINSIDFTGTAPQGAITIQLNPTTTTDFNNVVTTLLNYLNNNSTTVTSGVYTSVYRVYDAVYGAVYSYTVYLVYNAANTDHLNTITLPSVVYKYWDGKQWVPNAYVEVPVPVPKTTSGGGGGGGGGAPAPAPTTTPTDYGQVQVNTSTGTITVTIDAAKVASLLNQAAPTVVLPVEVPAGTTVKQVEVPIPAQTLQQAAEKGKAIELALPGMQVVLPPGVIPSGQLTGGNVTFKAEMLAGEAAKPYTSNLASGMTAASSVVELNLSTAGGSASLARPVTLALSYQTTADPNLLGIYRYNEAGKQWEYVGGRVDKAAQRVQVQLSHFSKYAVLAYEKNFTDTTGHWAQADIKLMAARHIAAGKTDTLFAPDDNVTRAEFAALLLRSLGIAEVQPAAARFKDVQPGAWYYGAVEAASRAGLVGGYEDGTFRPDALITREEMAAMITRALAYAGKPVTVDDAAALLARFTDAAAVSGWAQQAVAAAVKSGIVAGRTANTIVPQASATRAEAIVMLKRLLVNTGAI
ncbi:S-layer homology domain protein [Neomoorella glycerini]|uniref:S-layer homology domain protein n=1 Tax=Neomoorella glycerini TaxID=55779 RepID=A0A6I5ZRM2_9FIRM|nr:S-layer homology domain-containing protein [Moorella glycerini]QGP92644.1 S-layer homology domain protein [Moorella glycerini]